MLTATVILKDLSDEFYHGYTMHGIAHTGFLDMDSSQRWAECNRITSDGYCKSTLKIGNGSFRDKVDLNHMMKNGGRVITCKLEPRKGYKLATFEFAK